MWAKTKLRKWVFFNLAEVPVPVRYAAAWRRAAAKEHERQTDRPGVSGTAPSDNVLWKTLEEQCKEKLAPPEEPQLWGRGNVARHQRADATRPRPRCRDSRQPRRAPRGGGRERARGGVTPPLPPTPLPQPLRRGCGRDRRRPAAARPRPGGGALLWRRPAAGRARPPAPRRTACCGRRRGRCCPAPRRAWPWRWVARWRTASCRCCGGPAGCSTARRAGPARRRRRRCGAWATSCATTPGRSWTRGRGERSARPGGRSTPTAASSGRWPRSPPAARWRPPSASATWGCSWAPPSWTTSSPASSASCRRACPAGSAAPRPRGAPRYRPRPWGDLALAGPPAPLALAAPPPRAPRKPPPPHPFSPLPLVLPPPGVPRAAPPRPRRLFPSPPPPRGPCSLSSLPSPPGVRGPAGVGGRPRGPSLAAVEGGCLCSRGSGLTPLQCQMCSQKMSFRTFTALRWSISETTTSFHRSLWSWRGLWTTGSVWRSGGENEVFLPSPSKGEDCFLCQVSWCLVEQQRPPRKIGAIGNDFCWQHLPAAVLSLLCRSCSINKGSASNRPERCKVSAPVRRGNPELAGTALEGSLQPCFLGPCRGALWRIADWHCVLLSWKLETSMHC